MQAKTILNLFLLLSILGFPRIYGTEIPFALLLMPFFINTVISQYWRNLPLFVVISTPLLALVCVGIAAWIAGSGESKDIFFMLIQAGKLMLSFFFAPVIYLIINHNPGVLVAWIVIQIFTIIGSAYSSQAYVFLLGFISPRSADVFVEVIGLRAVGFGLYHVDGALLLISAVFLASVFEVSGFLRVISVIGAALMARSAFVAYLIVALFSKSRAYVKELALLIVLCLFLIGFNFAGPLQEALEIFRSLASGGEVGVASIDHLSTMYILPQHLETYIWGDGKFFDNSTSELAFYMGTDVGYLRLLYFGGVFFTAVFLLLNVAPLMAVLLGRYYSMPFRALALSLILVFLIINLKGLQAVPIVAFAMPFFRVSNCSRS